MNLTYQELLHVTEHSHTRGGQAGFVPAYVARRETILHMPQAEQSWQEAVGRWERFVEELQG